MPALQSARTEGRKLQTVAEETKTTLRLCGETENADAGHLIIAPAFEKRRAEKAARGERNWFGGGADRRLAWSRAATAVREQIWKLVIFEPSAD